MSARVIPLPPRPSAAETLRGRGATLVPSTAQERAELIDGTPWCHRLSWREEEGIGRFVRLYRLTEGTRLFTEGDHDAFSAIVVKGMLEIRKGDSASHDHVVARLGPGKMVGEMSLIDGAPRSATAVAAQPSDLLVLTGDEFEEMKRVRPELALTFALMVATALAQLVRQTTGALVEHLEQ